MTLLLADYQALLPQAPLVLIVIGAFGGFLSGFLGIGGGIVFVPALYFAFSFLNIAPEYVMHVVMGSSLATVFLTGIMSARGHYLRGAVDMGVLRAWIVFLVLGVAGGAALAAYVDGRALKMGFAVVTLLMAVYMATGMNGTAATRHLHFLTLSVQRALCAIIGAVAALTGMGGSVMTVPLMTRVGVPMQRAVGTGSALGLAVSLPAMMGYALIGLQDIPDLPPFSIGYVNIAAAGLMAITSMPMAGVGVRASHRIGKKTLRHLFAIMLAIVSVKMFLSL